MANWKRWAGGAAGAAALLTAVVGLAHTPAGRPLLRWMGKAAPQAAQASCPLGYGPASSPADAEAARLRSVASLKGSARAPERPALSFTLGASRRSDVEAWASQHHIACKAAGPVRLTCTAVPAAALAAGSDGPPTNEVYLQFDPAGRLVSVGTIRLSADADDAARACSSAVDALSQRLGSPGVADGERSGAYLQGGLLRQARAEFHFADYFASVNATHTGPGRFALSERYELLGDGG